MGNLEKLLTWGLAILFLGYLFVANSNCDKSSSPNEEVTISEAVVTEEVVAEEVVAEEVVAEEVTADSTATDKTTEGTEEDAQTEE
jgi:hypothetical protein